MRDVILVTGKKGAEVLFLEIIPQILVSITEIKNKITEIQVVAVSRGEFIRRD